MQTISVIGAVLVACGILYMAAGAIFRSRMTEPHTTTSDPASVTLEPRRRGMGFLSFRANWPGLFLIIIGALMLLFPLLLPF